MKKVMVEISDDPKYCLDCPAGKSLLYQYMLAEMYCGKYGDEYCHSDLETNQRLKCKWCLDIFPADEQVRSIKPHRTCLECAESCPGEQSSGLLADLCDILFDDPNRAENHGYEGVLERAREMMEPLKNPKRKPSR